jgi:hypothetical protein
VLVPLFERDGLLSPEMPDELFESQHESLKREFANIERRFKQ